MHGRLIVRMWGAGDRLRKERFRQSLDKSANLIANPAIAVALFFRTNSFGSQSFCQGRRIGKTGMEHFFRPRKIGAGLVGVIADCDDSIEDNIAEAIDMF
jgi:hypothetical protein